MKELLTLLLVDLPDGWSVTMYTQYGFTGNDMGGQVVVLRVLNKHAGFREVKFDKEFVNDNNSDLYIRSAIVRLVRQLKEDYATT